ncbi:hypothetical protein SAMD00019534_069590 [Acytostelium subglobosum LB1]|uniref:hypothetical protein n=1 Tax=Acytostelium subglobosum LB1 TaxID=1410327 RepID=UPI0006449577|nr:hypothetical protein SAMD00019534_069590 [Acytostelium subglobosum LB1]GAM23784.1 hypothetical protein SAMD00019534_069590 [Acytostelium subglobosum LB1]|eukprot:XP_012753525.1 hypothetical protein SAMD00019534_069590 [Acytostelium subglobosum LB1]
MSINHIPLLLVQKIVSHVESNIDRLCLLLTCNKFFENRDKLLLFRMRAPLNDERRDLKELCSRVESGERFSMNSFRQQMLDTLRIAKATYGREESLYLAEDCEDDDEYEFDDDIQVLELSHDIASKNTPRISFNFMQIPPTVHVLMLEYYEQVIPPNTIPCSIVDVTLGKHYRFPLQVGTIPESVTSLSSALISLLELCHDHCYILH